MHRGVLPHVQPAQVERRRRPPPRAAGPAGRRRARRRRARAASGRRSSRSASSSAGQGIRRQDGVRRGAGHLARAPAARWRPAAGRCRAAPAGTARRRGTASRRRRPRPARTARRWAAISRSDMDSSSARQTSSARWWRSAVAAWEVVARRTASAVTNGLPSRSPPIHEPGRSIGRGQQVGVRPALAQRTAQLGVDLRHDLEQREVVVAQRLLDLVGQPQPAQPQQRGLPQGEDLAPQVRRPGALVDVEATALLQQVADLLLHLGDRLAPHLGGVRGDDGHDQRPGQLTGDDVGVQFASSSRSSEAARLPFCGGEPSRRWCRRRRSWCTSSAMLASSEKWLNARMTWLADFGSSPASRSASSRDRPPSGGCGRPPRGSTRPAPARRRRPVPRSPPRAPGRAAGCPPGAGSPSPGRPGRAGRQGRRWLRTRAQYPGRV